ncbi:hypothetical protein NQ176_g4914 [Zarea fungicola]|uniref:Uncharacterized protein n=1 Tax=Zarea fungicola TaxID=93591 RepID=A0ACC1ND00_9HYPO|nr:hypothetical protein NQ176_g4914 [Lecanicillium fungicola]
MLSDRLHIVTGAGLLTGLASVFCVEAITLRPADASAAKNAHRIFNQLSDAGRQWGSSLNHNGLGFFPAIVPAGTVLYHGDRTDQQPTGMEWLAFEVEHAELFAPSHLVPPGVSIQSENKKKVEIRSQQQLPLLNTVASGHHIEPNDPTSPGDCAGDCDNTRAGSPVIKPHTRGYLHTYQVLRDLHILYIDGMSAAKTNYGTLDSQDLVLCDDKIGNISVLPSFGDPIRATMICELLADWGYDGFIRMETGFELIHCDFSKGLEFVSARRTFYTRDKMGNDKNRLFQLARGVADRYDGLGADRLKIDFSSMVSGWYFPINLTYTDTTRPDLIRFGSVGPQELRMIKDHISHVCKLPRRFTVDWQAATDMIVKRYSRKFAFMMSPNISAIDFIEEIELLTLMYVDAPSLPGDTSSLLGMEGKPDSDMSEEIARCTENYLLPALSVRGLWELEDRLIYTAIETVTRNICTTIFTIWAALLTASKDGEHSSSGMDAETPSRELKYAVDKGRREIRELMENLGWSEFKKVSPCLPNELMFVAMWPMGNEEDHFNPRCVAAEEFDFYRRNYW